MEQNNKSSIVGNKIGDVGGSVIAGGTHYHYNSDGKLTLPKHLTLIPGVTKFFTGREQSLEQLHQRLFKGVNNFILLVNGEGGIGKTTFAAEYCNKYQDEYNHIAWVVKETGIVDALFMLELPFKLSIEGLSREQRLNQLIGFMQNLTEPCLLVIDNANDPDDIAQNMHLLRACNKFHLLITTRVTEYGDQNDRFQINSLPFEEAQKLFAEIYRGYTPTDETILLSIYKAVGGNTLVLELLAKNLSELNRRPNGYGLQNLLEDIQQKGILKITAQKTVTTGHWTYTQLQKQTPEEVITTLFDLTELQEEEKLLLRQITLLPPESIEYTVAQSLFKGYPNFENLFNKLTTLGWLTYNDKEHSFKFSPVVQQISAAQTQVTVEASGVLVYNLIDQLDNDGGFSFRYHTLESASVYVRYAENVLRGLQNHPDYNVSILPGRIGVFYRAIGDYNKALEYFKLYNELRKELYASNPQSEEIKNGLAISYERLGSIYQSQGESGKALEYFKLDNELTQELYASNSQSEEIKNGLAISYSKLGSIYQSQGESGKALEYFKLSNELIKELYASNPQSEQIKNGLAISYEKLGSIYQSQGESGKALEYFKLDNELTKELYASNPQSEQIKNGLAISYEKLGSIYQSQGESGKALEYFKLDNELRKELYASNPQSEEIKNGLAISYERLGSIYQSQGESGKALEYFKLYNELTKELYASNPQSEQIKNGLAVSYERLGSIYQSQGESGKALEYFKLYNELRKELYASNPQSEEIKNGLAISYSKLGEIYQSQRESGKALEYFKLSNELIKELYASNPQSVKILEGLAISYYKLAMLYKSMGEDTKGKANFSEWKSRISYLAENFPQIPKYQEWDKLEY